MLCSNATVNREGTCKPWHPGKTGNFNAPGRNPGHFFSQYPMKEGAKGRELSPVWVFFTESYPQIFGKKRVFFWGCAGIATLAYGEPTEKN